MAEAPMPQLPRRRLTWDEYFTQMATLASGRATCRRRSVGCVLVDIHHHVLATGYNGPPSKFPHCLDEPCPGASQPSGTGLDLCYATHAEQNALMQCSNVQAIDVCYTTTWPCITCIKLLLNTSCERIVFTEDYPHPISIEMWRKAGRLRQQQQLQQFITR